jgi:hypothetical protein
MEPPAFPPLFGDPYARDFELARARDDALGCRGRDPVMKQAKGLRFGGFTRSMPS